MAVDTVQDGKNMTEEQIKVVEAMEQYGGSFVKCLAKCFWQADHINFEKLKTAFSEYWQQYEEMANRKNEES